NWKLELHDIEIEQFYGDELRIKQVYANIITNAIKYTKDEGSITVTISERVNDSSCLLSFICRDNGIGMSKDFLSRIFLPFERVNNSTVSKIEGSGLGMSIVKSLVEAMSGTIAVDSEVGVGTEVRVDIPLKFEKIKVETENLAGKRILVIESDSKLSERYREIFDQFDLAYEIVPSAAQAVSSVTEADFSGNGYDIAIIGCVLENSGNVIDVSGYLHKVKPDLSIVLVSDADWEEIEYRAIRSGIQMFIPAPFFRKSLINGLNRVAGQSKSGQEDSSMPNLEDKHILLVEDNLINQMIALEILQTTKATVDTAEDGEQAIKIFEGSEIGYYDIIFMDIQMPVMDGYEATSRIRASNREDGKTVPIYAMTANTFAEDIAKARSCGMDGHIAKPIDINNVMHVLRHL
ncbi:MAG: response regulator, partial [Spirochaetales bacterium]|nr:response regulator [Spirochaetales bacterium]